MDRRELLKSGFAAAFLSGLWDVARLGAEEAAGTKRYIDIHCHVFNARDLPAEGFIRKVFLRERIEDLKAKQPFLAKILAKNPQAVDVAIDIISSTLRKETPTYADEIKFLDDLEKGKVTPPKLAERQARDQKMLRQILRIFWDVKLLSKNLKDKSIANVALLGEASLYLKYWLRREVHSRWSEDPREDANLNPPDENDSDQIAALIYGSDGPLGHTLRWLLLFSRYRFELVDMLAGLNGPSRPTLIAPALVDFEMWIRDIPHRSPEEPVPTSTDNQVKVMKRISCRRDEHAPMVHGFVAYDPLRQCLHENKKIQAPKSPFEVVKSAITESGFLGVKVYPPMGFVPFGNKGKKLPNEVTKKYGLKDDIGERFDHALLDLFVWCAENGVPILAHANDSNEPYLGGGKKADPNFWEEVLKQKPGGKDLSGLRLNLAHVGGFEESVEKGLPDAKVWEWEIGRIKKTHPNANVFADISYFNEIIPIPNRSELNEEDEAALDQRRDAAAATLKKVKKKFEEFRDAYDNTADFLMYGSDWIMLGLEQGITDQSLNKSKRYLTLVEEFLDDIGYNAAARKKILFGNQIRYLGLAAGQPARLRLTEFYQKNKLDPARLAVFD
jgi:hypothetical protein